MQRVTLHPGNKKGEAPIGTPIRTLLLWHLKAMFKRDMTKELVAVMINGKLTGLDAKLSAETFSLEPILGTQPVARQILQVRPEGAP